LHYPKKFKISGSGESTFRKLHKIYRKNEEKKKSTKINIRKLRSIDFSNLNLMRDFTEWEKPIFKKIKNSGFKIEFKFRKFGIRIGEKYFVYIPDVMVSGFRVNDKKIIIEAHENLQENDIMKYRKFLREYRHIYHLIMIVEDSQLRRWNESNDNGFQLFDEIWVKEDVNYLIEKLIDYKTSFEKKFYNFPNETYCGRNGCGEEAHGYEEIEKLFGYRELSDGKIIPQSYCRYCRSNSY